MLFAKEKVKLYSTDLFKASLFLMEQYFVHRELLQLNYSLSNRSGWVRIDETRQNNV